MSIGFPAGSRPDSKAQERTAASSRSTNRSAVPMGAVPSARGGTHSKRPMLPSALTWNLTTMAPVAATPDGIVILRATQPGSNSFGFVYPATASSGFTTGAGVAHAKDIMHAKQMVTERMDPRVASWKQTPQAFLGPFAVPRLLATHPRGAPAWGGVTAASDSLPVSARPVIPATASATS